MTENKQTARDVTTAIVEGFSEYQHFDKILALIEGHNQPSQSAQKLAEEIINTMIEDYVDSAHVLVNFDKFTSKIAAIVEGHDSAHMPGKTTAAFMQFYRTGINGLSAAFVCKNGNFLSPKAVEELNAEVARLKKAMGDVLPKIFVNWQADDCFKVIDTLKDALSDKGEVK